MIDSNDLTGAYHNAKDVLEHNYQPMLLEPVGTAIINGVTYKVDIALVQDLTMPREQTAIREIQMKLIKGD